MEPYHPVLRDTPCDFGPLVEPYLFTRESAMNANSLPTNFDAAAFEEQLTTWLQEGHAEEDILAQAQHTWPELLPGYALATLHQLQDKPADPLADLHRIQRRRARHLRKIEKALLAEDAPVSLHNLYRGLLRDQEAGCYKLLENNKQMEAVAVKHQKKSQASELKKDIAEARQLRQQSKQLDKELANLLPASPKAPSKNSTVTTLSWLISFILSLFLTGCSASTRTATTILYTVSSNTTHFATDSDPGTDDGRRQRTAQLHAPSAEDHQAILQRTAHDHARTAGPTCG